MYFNITYKGVQKMKGNPGFFVVDHSFSLELVI